MQSSAENYYLEVNGIAEGPMTVRDLVWKIGMTNSDDVILFRTEGSADWQPLEGNRERLKQLASSEAGTVSSPPSPPKLKLKKRGDSPSPSGNETPPPFPSEPPASLNTPPPPPGAPGYQPAPPILPATPPPLPQFNPGNQAPPLPPTAPTPVPQFNPGSQAPPLPPAAPTPPPVRITTLLTASFVITSALAGYIFFLMPQDVAASAKRRTETSYTREVGGLNYAVLTKSQAEAWKEESLEKLASFGDKAKAEAAASAGRSLTTTASAQEITAKHAAAAKALALTGINAISLSKKYDRDSASDIRALRSLELAMEISAAYLPPECREDMDRGRFAEVALAVRGVGFRNLKSAFEAEILSAETNLRTELAQIRPTADEAKDLARKTTYEVPAEIDAVARGTSDVLGKFDLRLTPGDYYVIATAPPLGDSPSIAWARSFNVRPLTENNLILDDSNIGSKGDGSLWKTGDTLAIERDIATIVEQAGRLDSALNATEKLRADIDELKAKIGRLLDN